MVKEIKIKCKGAIELDLKELHPFQGELKSLSKNNYNKLRKQILELGFSEPMSVWKNAEGQWMILNAHQRYKVLTEMRDAEGYIVPKIPCSVVDADSEYQAKKKVLSLTSQFGEISTDSLFEFASLANISLPELEDFRFPEIEKLGLIPDEFKEPEAKKDPEEKEFEAKVCPNCQAIIE